VGGKDEVVAILIVVKFGGLQIGGIEPLRVHHRARHVLEDQEFLWRQAQVVAIRRASEAEHRALLLIRLQMPNQPRLERLQHAGLCLFGDPAIVLEH